MESSPQVAFVGLGAMGFGIAVHLVNSSFIVTGYDIDQNAIDSFARAGQAARSSREAVKDAAVIILKVVSAAQIDSILFDPRTGVASSLRTEAALITLDLGGVQVIDCPVSGGAARAADGNLKIFVSGNDEVWKLHFARTVLETMAEKVQVIPGGLGVSTKIKLINQQLAGIHIAAAAEAMAMAIGLGLNPRQIYRSVVESDAWSWMFEDRVRHMLDADWAPKSALDIFVKDIGIVAEEGSQLDCPMPLSSMAQQLYITASANGYGREDDSGLIRLYPVQRSVTPSTELDEANDTGKTANVISLLRAIHLVAAAEDFALCDKLELSDELVIDSISGAAGSSRLFETYGAFLVRDRTGHSAFDVVKEGLGEAVSIGRKLGLPMFLSATSLQSLLLAKESPGEGRGLTAFIQCAFEKFQTLPLQKGNL